MLGYLNSAVPLEEIDDKKFAEQVNDIRRFAMEELGLKTSRNYTSYVQLDRNYLASIVSASAQDSFTRHQWHFPVVGAMPYKGFFNVNDARKERARLEKKGLDVWIRGVDAFSTLGWFKDPLYSYMKEYSTSRLADLIIHELVHSTVFLKGQVQFNEELAEFIGTEGARLYMETRYGADSEEYQAMFIYDADNKAYVDFIRALIAELDDLYSGSMDKAEKLRQKEQIVSAAKERFAEEYESRFSNDNYRGFLEIPVNNAYLELYRLYYAEEDFFADLYARAGSNLAEFIAAAKTVTKKGNPRKQLENALLK